MEVYPNANAQDTDLEYVSTDDTHTNTHTHMLTAHDKGVQEILLTFFTGQSYKHSTVGWFSEILP